MFRATCVIGGAVQEVAVKDLRGSGSAAIAKDVQKEAAVITAVGTW